MNKNDETTYLTPKFQLPADGIDVSQASFMTADESGNTTFFSMLEESTTETILDNDSYHNLEENEHDFTFTNSHDNSVKQDREEDDDEVDVQVDQELVIFKSPNSTKLFGLQNTQDVDGNYQKYQYEVLQNEDGQFESVPGTISLVPYHTTPASVIRQIEELESGSTTLSCNNVSANNNGSLNISSSNPHVNQKVLKQNINEYITGIDLPEDDSETTEDQTDALKVQHHLKDELQIEFESNLQEITISNKQPVLQEDFDSLCMNLIPNSQNLDLQESEDPLQDRYIPDQVVEYHEHIQNTVIDTDPQLEVDTEEDACNLSPVAVKQGILESALKGIYSPVKSEHALGVYMQQDHVIETCEEVVNPCDFVEQTVDEDVIRFQKIEDSSGHRTVVLYPISKEKTSKSHFQAMTSIELPVRRLSKQVVTQANNKGAILKSFNSLKRPHGLSNVFVSPQKENLNQQQQSASVRIIKKNNARRSMLQTVTAVEDDSEDEEDGLRANNLVEASKTEKKKMPSWNVNKMISQTKIIEAPVRQERLPRKQKIKPLDRVGEELVFQHVTVSASGIIETKVDGVVQERTVLEPSECINLSDNEDEFTRKTRKRNSKLKHIEIVISDSDEEKNETDLVEIAVDPAVEKTGSMDTISESSSKLENANKCSKPLPSLESFELPKQCLDAQISADTKHKCSICSESFKNVFLLNKHEQVHKQRMKNECPDCKRLFKTGMELTGHKKECKNKVPKDNQTSFALNLKEKRPIRTVVKSTTLQAVPEINKTVSETPCTSAVVQKSGSTQKNQNKTLNRKSMLPRKSMMPSTTSTSKGISNKKSALPVIRKSLLPSKMPPPASTRPSTSARLSTVPTRHSNAVASTSATKFNSKMYRCFSCHNSFPNKFMLDSHVIKSCVKSPRRSTLKVGLSLAKKSSSTPDMSPMPTSQKAKITFSASKRISMNKSKMSLSTRSLGKLTPVSKSTNSLDSTFGTKNGGNSAKKLPLSERHRIPTNAGIPVTHLQLPFVKLKRKLMEENGSDWDDI